MAASPITPSDLEPVTDGANACEKLTELENTRRKMQEFLEWLLTDDDAGNLGDGFKEAIIEQLLADDEADPELNTNGGFVKTDATTGELEVVEQVALSEIAAGGAAEGDFLIFDGEAWVKKSRIYLAPSSGGTTVPDPAAGGILSVAHGLAETPREFGCVLECNTDDVGYFSVEENRVNAACLELRTASPENSFAVTVGADDTNVYCVFFNGGGSATYRLINKSTFAKGTITPASWNVKLWVMP